MALAIHGSEEKLPSYNTLLDAGWMKLIHELFLLMENKEKRSKVNSEVIGQTLTVVIHMLLVDSSALSLRVFDEGYAIICAIFKHDLLVNSVRQAEKSTVYWTIHRLLTSVLYLIYASPSIHAQRTTQIQEQNMEEILNTYFKISHSMEDNLIPETLSLYQLTSIEFLTSPTVLEFLLLDPTDNNVEHFIDTMKKVIEKLCQVPVENLLENLWLYKQHFM